MVKSPLTNQQRGALFGGEDTAEWCLLTLIRYLRGSGRQSTNVGPGHHQQCTATEASHHPVGFWEGCMVENVTFRGVHGTVEVQS